MIEENELNLSNPEMQKLQDFKFNIDDDGIAELCFQCRTLTERSLRELETISFVCERNDKIKKIILTGEGRVFCAGGDLRDFVDAGDKMPEQVQKMAETLNKVILRFVQTEKPIIAVVNGVAAGAGVSLAAMADKVIATHNASFTSAFSKVGLSPDGGLTYSMPNRLEKKVGKDDAKKVTDEFIESNKTLTAVEAKEFGLVDDLFASQEESLAFGRSLEGVGKFPIDTVELTRRMSAELKETVRRAGLSDTMRKMQNVLAGLKR